MTEIRKSILAGLVFGLIIGLFQAFKSNINHALIAGSISGIVFGIILYSFMTSKTVKRQTQIESPDGKPIVCSGWANHVINVEGVGGRLYLLTDKLQFQSHSFNIQNHGLKIDIEKIKDISFYNTLGLIPNGLVITTLDGQKEKFVVDNRRLWKEEIERLKSKIILI